MKVLAIALNTFREAVRNKILYSAVLFAIVLVGVSAFFGSVTIGSQVEVIKDFGLFSISFFGSMLAIISGVSLLNKELKHKTIYNILSKPVERWQFIVGKHLGLALTVSLLVTLMGVLLSLFLLFFEGKIDLLLFQGIGFTVLEVFVISSVTIFFSSVVITTTLTGLFTLAAYIVGRSINALNYYVSNEEISTPVILKIVNILDIILPDLSVFNVADTVVQGISVTSSQVGHAIIYCISYSMIMLCLSALIFSRRELN